MKLIKLLLILCLPTIGWTQKKVIDFETHDTWKTLGSVKYSDDGNIVTYQINPYKGDGNLFIKKPDGQLLKKIERAQYQKVHHQGKFVVYKIPNFEDSIRKLKIDDVSRKKWPNDSLGVYLTDQDSIFKMSDVKSYDLSEKGDFLAIMMENNDDPNPPKKKYKGILWWKKEVKNKVPKSDGKRLVLYNPISGDSIYWLNVKDFGFDKKGKNFYFTTAHQPKKSDSINVYHVDLTKSSLEAKKISKEHTEAKGFSFDEEGDQLAYLVSKDTSKENKVFQLMYFTPDKFESKILVDSLTKGLPADYTVSKHQNPYFSESGKRLFLGVDEIPRQEEKDSIPDDEKAKLDIWHWQDGRIQPEQLKSKIRDEGYCYLSYYHFDEDKVVVLGNDTLKNIRVLKDGDGEYAYVSHRGEHNISRSWDWPWKSNYYRIDLKDGAVKSFKEDLPYGLKMHPDGKLAAFYEPKDSSWYVVDEKGQVKCLTFYIDDNFAEDVNGMPYLAGDQGLYGWTESGEAIIYSEREIYKINPNSPENYVQLSKGISDQPFKYTFNNQSKDSIFVYPENDFLVGVNQENQSTTLWNNYQDQEVIVSGEFALYLYPRMLYLKVPENNDQLLFLRRMNLQTYPDLEVVHFDKKNEIVKLSETNPQKGEYNWAEMERFEYTSLKGDTLPALIYYPENLDRSKKYPVIFYYYEKYQDRTHYHYMPKPSASVINFTEFASNGYIVVVPDIIYEPGHPAQSAYDCIMGVTNDAIKKFPFIDSTKMGLQGQSWGGYQTAQLITMTNRYHAASAGAPVSNMFSAYGGIRWGSGLSREFQYERTQSRIGGTIWEVPELYKENSPIFGLPNVETPVLIMHNDDDGAVPWYQGIEMFMGLRRLGKPAWMLNYNDDSHNLMKTKNRRDLSKRLMQFFDTFLKDEPAPHWIEEGVPAVEKGKNYGFDPVKE